MGIKHEVIVASRTFTFKLTFKEDGYGGRSGNENEYATLFKGCDYCTALSLSENFMHAHYHLHGWLDSHKTLAAKVRTVHIEMSETIA